MSAAARQTVVDRFDIRDRVADYQALYARWQELYRPVAGAAAPAVRQPSGSAVDPESARAPGPHGDASGAMTTPASSPLVSVLVTAYNREAYIAEALESVLAQTMTDFELIVSDDQSTDGTVRDRRADCAPRSARPRLGERAQPRRLSGTAVTPRRSRAARYLKYHDSDDVMYPHCLAVMVEPLETEPTAAFALSAQPHWPGGAVPDAADAAPRVRARVPRLRAVSARAGRALFRADVFRALGGFRRHGVASDYLFWVAACAKVNVLLVPGDLFYYRIHAGQEMSRAARTTLPYAQAPATPGGC